MKEPGSEVWGGSPALVGGIAEGIMVGLWICSALRSLKQDRSLASPHPEEAPHPHSEPKCSCPCYSLRLPLEAETMQGVGEGAVLELEMSNQYANYTLETCK